MKKFIISVETSFKASHAIVMKGRRETFHTHPWKVQAHFETRKLDRDGIALDFVAAKKALRKLAQQFHGRKINHVPPFNKINPTAERVAQWFYNRMNRREVKKGTRLIGVTIWEGPDCSVKMLGTHP